MQAETRTLTHLFQLDVRYVIPLYQRPYVWTEERQWAPLWEDIATVADHVAVEGASPKSPSHFLGAIVIEQQENPPGTPQQYLVIDGQQRLTTLQLLLAAASRTADEAGCAGEAELLRRLTYNNALLAHGEDRFKVWPTNANREAFSSVMDPEGSPDEITDDPDNEIQEAYSFFCRQIASWATDSDGGQPAAQFAALRVTLGYLLKLVAIRLEEGDSPQVIFETLNGRGTPLIALDLLKNAVFLAAAKQEVDTDHLYTDHWAPELDRDYWRENRRAGRLFTKNGDLFLQYWLIAELAEPVPATELFDTFRDQVLQRVTCPPMEELIPALARDARILRGFEDATPGSPERRFFDLLDLLDTTTLMPIALLLLRSEQVSAERRGNAFSALESFLIRRMICGWTTKNYNRLAAGLIGEIKDDLPHADDVIRRRLAAETAPANSWPRDDDLRSALVQKDMYGHRRQDRLVEVLWRIEEHMREADNKVEQGLAAPGKLTLEHLIPQSWEEHWPLDATQDDPLAWRNAHLHKLGNLTLTTGPLNSSLSNGPWHSPDKPKDKRRGLVAHSLLKLNTTVAHRYPERFDERSVDDRGKQLADIVAQIWPGPPALGPSASSSPDPPADVVVPAAAGDDEAALLDESSRPPRTRRVFEESVADLIATGLLQPGIQLRPTSEKHDTMATVLSDGRVRVGDETFNALSTAARHISGKTEAGWHFWSAPTTDGRLVPLHELRDQLRAQGGAPPPPEGSRRGPGKMVYDVTVGQLVEAGLVRDGEAIVALRKRVGSVEGTIHDNGSITVHGQRYPSLSAAATAVSGTSSEAGWEYWAVRRGDELVSLYELRRRCISQQGQ